MFTETEMTEMSLEIEAIADLIKAIEFSLEEEKKNSEIKPNSNVIYADLGILNEFDRLRSAELTLPQVIAIYHDWADRSFSMCLANRGRLQKGKLRYYLEDCLGQLLTIQKILPTK